VTTGWVRVLRFALPAIVGTVVGIWLEANVWRGRGATLS
jgi:hypothetical protein